ncbi:hypothetical protein [Streptomyces sp. B6(2022)]
MTLSVFGDGVVLTEDDWLRIPALDVPDMDVLIGLVDENRT